MLGFIVGLGLTILLPLILLAIIFDVAMFMFVFGFKALKIGFRILCGVFGIIGLIFTIPLIIALMVML